MLVPARARSARSPERRRPPSNRWLSVQTTRRKFHRLNNKANSLLGNEGQWQLKSKPRRRDRKSVPVGQAHIKSTFNNTIISITDPSGAVVSWASGGDVGFKGSRKSTPYAAGMAAESAARKAMEHGLKKVDVFVKGPGSGRETAIRSLQSAGLEVGSITDVTPQAHNGVRPPKRRRV